MKIWHLTKTLSGGAGQYALRLSNALRAAGMESTMLVAEGAVSDGSVLLKRVDSPVRRFVARGFRSLLHRIAFGAYHSLRGPELYEAVQAIQAGDIVHLHGMTGWIGASGLGKLIPRGASVFWTAHDLWCVSGGCVVYAGCERFKSGCKNCPILRMPVRWLLPRMELANKQRFIRDYQIHGIANSHWMRRQLINSKIFSHQREIQVVPPIIHNAFLKPQQREGARRQLDLDTDKFVITMGARAVTDQFKGIEPFLKELAKDEALASKVLVLLFGDGKIPIPKSTQVREFGAVNDPNKLATVLTAADVFISPSKMETFGMTLVEAQACGTPVLSFSVGGTPEAVRDGETGWLLPFGDFHGLIECLRSLVGDAQKRVAVGNKAREWTQNSFCGDTVARQQESIYANIKKFGNQ